MSEFISYPHIGQFRNVCSSVKQRAQYTGKDENGDPVYDRNIILPTLRFTGTVKSHGTNAGVSFQGDNLWFQSHKHKITPEKDNAGFAFFAQSNLGHFRNIVKQVPHADDEIVTIFGEWCGGNVQGASIAIAGLEKMFIMFDICVAKANDDKLFLNKEKFDAITVNNEANIYHTKQFRQFELDIDFTKSQYYLPTLVDFTHEVEEECPIGKFFKRDKENGDCVTGEGIVWKYQYEDGSDLTFKTKGEKHSNSKVKKIKVTHEPEVLESIDKFVDYAVNHNRLSQAYNELENPTVKNTGDIIKWMMGDICKEEMDVMVENKLEPKMVASQVGARTREWFFKKLDEEL